MQVLPKNMQLHLQIYKKSIENAKKRIKNDNLYVIVCELIFFLIILLRI